MARSRTKQVCWNSNLDSAEYRWHLRTVDLRRKQ